MSSPTRSPFSTPDATRPRDAALARASHSPNVIELPSTTRTAGRSRKRSARAASSWGISTRRLSSASVPNGASPILVGILYDFPQHDGGAGFEEAVRLGLAEVELDRPVELVARQAAGLPAGTAHDVREKYFELIDAGVLAIIGPAISDNAFVVREVCDAMEVPLVNYTGGERTRSEFMFHYQAGSLAEGRAGL